MQNGYVTSEQLVLRGIQTTNEQAEGGIRVERECGGETKVAQVGQQCTHD